MKKTTLGFEIRSVGLNPFASEYAGMSSKRTIVLSMVISGALAGLGGVVEGLGTYQNFFVQTTSLSIGFDGMAVSLLGSGSAIGILLSAILFSILKIGGLGMQTGAGVPFEIVNVWLKSSKGKNKKRSLRQSNRNQRIKTMKGANYNVDYRINCLDPYFYTGLFNTANSNVTRRNFF